VTSVIDGIPAEEPDIEQLRTAVNAVRALAGLEPATFTDSLEAGVLIKAIHILELRLNLNEARLALGLGAIVYTDPSLTTGVTRPKSAHIFDLRSGV
jgi:hypothetical protein